MTNSPPPISGTARSATTPWYNRPLIDQLLIPVVFFALYYTVSLIRYSRYLDGWDLGIFAQAIKAYSQGQAPYIPLKAQEPFNILGDHFSPVIALVAPVYRLFPHVETLLVVQAGLFAVSVGLMGRAARRILGREYAVTVTACFAMSWTVMAAVVFDFHEVCFVVPLLILAIGAAWEERWGWMSCWCALLMLTKEDSAFLVGGIALMLLARRHIRAGLILGASSVAYFVCVVRLVIPSFNSSGQYAYFSATPGSAMDLLGNAWAMVQHPRMWIIVALAALTCGPGVRTAVALVPVPVLLSRVIVNNPIYWSYSLHYQAPVFTACFWALMVGCAGLIRTHPGKTVRRLCLIYICALFVLSIAIIQGEWGWQTLLGIEPAPPRVESFNVVLAEVPPDVTIIADTYAIGHLVDSDTVLLATEDWTDSGGEPLDAAWVLLDRASLAQNNPTTSWVDARVNTLLSTGFTITAQDGSVILLTRS